VRVLLIGSGGREHALAWKLSQSPRLTELHAAPGNPGIAQLGECHPVRAEDAEGLLDLAHSVDADLVVVGPEAPLVSGVADELRHAGIAVFGPGKEAARIEGSKSFAKEVMRATGVPTAETMSEARAPCVVKADGLAAGKGVFVCRNRDELDAALREVARLGDTWLVEELLEGDEVSAFALASGVQTTVLPTAQDYKRAFDGDEGPNTGGMGAYSPVVRLDESAGTVELIDTIHLPVLRELAARGTPFVGVLFAGMMLTDAGPKVLEFNCRLGDPEAQVLLPRLEGDLLGAMAGAAAGDAASPALAVSDQAAVTVVIAAADYPARGDSGTPIEGIEDAESEGALVFQAGTAIHKGRVVTNGGRVLGVTGLGPSVEEARERAYEACGRISFEGMRFRRDIAARAVNVAT
jgi:phosphoribosylamine---glycine ligase